MTLNEPRTLGRTGLQVGRLGISSSFGAPAEAFEAAFERGCNYFTWGTFIKGRSSEMKKAVRNIIAKGQRDKLVIAFFTYAHNRFLTEHFFTKGMKALGLDFVDVLLLGYFPRRPGRRIIDGALALKAKGLTRHIGLSSHNRKLFPALEEEKLFDVFHIRYNAAHRGAETETFPYLAGDDRPGVVAFTATRWRQLLSQKKMPEDKTAPSAADCYRFVLSNPTVDVCMMGAKNSREMRENLAVLDQGPMSPEALAQMEAIGDYLHG